MYSWHWWCHQVRLEYDTCMEEGPCYNLKAWSFKDEGFEQARRASWPPDKHIHTQFRKTPLNYIMVFLRHESYYSLKVRISDWLWQKRKLFFICYVGPTPYFYVDYSNMCVSAAYTCLLSCNCLYMNSLSKYTTQNELEILGTGICNKSRIKCVALFLGTEKIHKTQNTQWIKRNTKISKYPSLILSSICIQCSNTVHIYLMVNILVCQGCQ